jgi:hypothetical protein
MPGHIQVSFGAAHRHTNTNTHRHTHTALKDDMPTTICIYIYIYAQKEIAILTGHFTEQFKIHKYFHY